MSLYTQKSEKYMENTVNARRYTEQSHSTATVCLHGSSKHKLIRET